MMNIWGKAMKNNENNFVAFYESPNRKTGTYNWDLRHWSVR
jgi:hypothetical protein